MLTEVKAYSSWRSAPTLLLDANGSPETDLIQIRNIVGLDPVKASINKSPYGSVDGTSYTGSSVLERNIVLTLAPKPDWNTWTYETLRRLIYSYFMPKLRIRLVLYSDDMIPVEIYGIVEDVSINIFSKDPEYNVSIICPDPYFSALNPTVLTGQSEVWNTFNYNGNVETGIVVKTTYASGAPQFIGIRLGNPQISYFGVTNVIDNTNYWQLSSIPMRKYVQSVNMGTGVITNLLSKIYSQEGTLWPILEPGENEFVVVTNPGSGVDYELIFYERFGGL